MQHPQLQKHEGLTPRMQLLYIVPSYVRHTNVVTFEMGLLQSKYFQCTSGKILHKTVKNFFFDSKISSANTNRENIVSYIDFIEFISGCQIMQNSWFMQI